MTMFVSDCLGLNELGHLTIGGCDTVALAQKYGTPLYVMDEDEIRRACASYRGSIERYYGGRGLVPREQAFCAGHVNCGEEGLGLDVVSGGFTQRSAQFPGGTHFFMATTRRFRN
ncbi:MAG: hypothetical protein ACLSDO_02025 [Anaerotruncus colihominis]